MSNKFEITTMSKKSGQVIWRLPKEASGALIAMDDESVWYRKPDGNLELADKTFLSVDEDGRCVRLSESRKIENG